MKLFVFIYLFTSAVFAGGYIIEPDGGSDGGSDTSSVNPWVRNFVIATECRGDQCPNSPMNQMVISAGKIYDLVQSRAKLNYHEIVTQFGISESADERLYRGAVQAVKEIQESIQRGETKVDYLKRQMDFVNGSVSIRARRNKANVIAEMRFRLGYAQSQK